MKKISKILFLSLFVFAISGCIVDKKVSVIIDESYKKIEFNEVESSVSLYDNIQKALQEIQAADISIAYYNEEENKNYSGELSVIFGETRKDICIVANTNIDGKELSFYVKEEMVYISYPFYGINGGIKDTINNFVNQSPTVLAEFNVTNMGVDDILDFLSKSTFDGLNLVNDLQGKEISFVKQGDAYSLSFFSNEVEVFIDLDQYFRPVRADIISGVHSLSVDIFYPTDKQELVFPASLNNITYFSINWALDLANVESVMDLVK